jgi:uncharacterized protein
MSTVQKLSERGIARPPRFIPTNMHYETIMGSMAYGVASDSSDFDVYGFCIPPKEELFPHLRGEIEGFGTPRKRFNVYQEHHLKDPDALGGKGREYDLTVYNIVDYFQLAMKNNPNLIDSLFTPETCVLHITRLGQRVREARRSFLHKGCWQTFKGYAYAQMHKMDMKVPVGKRKATIDKHGYDIKFAYHVVRLLDEAEQILATGDIDLQRNREQLKSIRRGEWTQEQIRDHFTRKEAELETLYLKSTLRAAPDEGAIRQLLLDCLEEHYGSLEKCIVNPDAATLALRQIEEIVKGFRGTM